MTLFMSAGRQFGPAKIGEFEFARITLYLRHEKLEDLLGNRAGTCGADRTKLRQDFDAIVERALPRDFEFIRDRFADRDAQREIAVVRLNRD
jgi:hypothetical protein